MTIEQFRKAAEQLESDGLAMIAGAADADALTAARTALVEIGRAHV
jgi:hypothetical protein